ncbi:hypothetical protein E2C01_017654 [Portunus trituberculatus]|uniref:Uncharacterized protein n=1 Tax=Portunus trituberculatus TaxID=210409 RepID=A0A5B7DU37_PORTR|nr:hypothetical protein [Portunus trituberculatus]
MKLLVTAHNVHNFKGKLDKWRHEDRTLCAPLESYTIQLGKYTHTHTHTPRSIVVVLARLAHNQEGLGLSPGSGEANGQAS